MPKSFRLWHAHLSYIQLVTPSEAAHLSYIQLVTPKEAAIAVKIDSTI